MLMPKQTKLVEGVIKVMLLLLIVLLWNITIGPAISSASKKEELIAWNSCLSQHRIHLAPPCPYPEDNVHWMAPHEWALWCSVSNFIKEANTKLTYEERAEMTDAILKWSNEHELPVGLVVAVCHVESNFNAKALGPKTKHGRARGAMQVMWPVHQGLAESCSVEPDGMFSADGGVCVGTFLLKRYIAAEGSISGCLAKYFSKPSRNYIIEKVMSSYLTFDRLHSGSIRTGNISCSHQNESTKLRKIVRGQ